jgi:hypothetical protein
MAFVGPFQRGISVDGNPRLLGDEQSHFHPVCLAGARSTGAGGWNW